MPSPAIHLHLLPRALSLAATSGPPTQPLLAATSPRLLPDSRSGAGGTGAAAKASARWSMALPPSSSVVGAGAAEKAGFVQLSRHHPCTREARPPTGHRRPLLLRSFSPLLVRERKTLCEKQGLKRRLKHGPKRRAALSVFYLRIDEGFVICSVPKNFSMVYVPVVHCIRGRGQQESKRALRCDGSTTQHQVEHTGLDGKRPVPSETYICQDRVEWQPGFCLLRFFVGLFVAVSLTNKALMQTIVNDELDVATTFVRKHRHASNSSPTPTSLLPSLQQSSNKMPVHQGKAIKLFCMATSKGARTWRRDHRRGRGCRETRRAGLWPPHSGAGGRGCRVTQRLKTCAAAPLCGPAHAMRRRACPPASCRGRASSRNRSARERADNVFEVIGRDDTKGREGRGASVA